MRDSQIFSAIIPVMNRGLIECGISGVAVKQANQPTQQGANTGPTCYITKLGNKLHGCPKREDVYDPVTGIFNHTESQLYESMFQVTALAMQNPSNINGPTADDILQAVIHSIQSDTGIASLRASGIGVLRITESNNPAFQDDQRRNEFSPSFTFTVLHPQVIVTANPAVESYEYRVNRV